MDPIYLDNTGHPFIPPAWSDMQGITDPAELTTTELLHLIEGTPIGVLTGAQVRTIRAEIKSRGI